MPTEKELLQEQVLFKSLQKSVLIQQDVIIEEEKGTNGFQHALAKGGMAYIFPAIHRITKEPLVLKVETPTGFTYLNAERIATLTQFGEKRAVQLRGFYRRVSIEEKEMEVFYPDKPTKAANKKSKGKKRTSNNPLKGKLVISPFMNVLSFVRYGPNLYEWAMTTFGDPKEDYKEESKEESKEEYWVPESIVAHIGYEMVSALQKVHKKGLVFADVSIQNAVVDTAATQNSLVPRLRLIDFGMAERVQEDTKEEKGETFKVKPEGSFPFNSTSSHLLQPVKYRDDLESLGYVLWWLAKGSLPWQELNYEGGIAPLMKLLVSYPKEKHDAALQRLVRIYSLIMDRRKPKISKTATIPDIDAFDVYTQPPLLIQKYFQTLSDKPDYSTILNLLHETRKADPKISKFLHGRDSKDKSSELFVQKMKDTMIQTPERKYDLKLSLYMVLNDQDLTSIPGLDDKKEIEMLKKEGFDSISKIVKRFWVQLKSEEQDLKNYLIEIGLSRETAEKASAAIYMKHQI